MTTACSDVGNLLSIKQQGWLANARINVKGIQNPGNFEQDVIRVSSTCPEIAGGSAADVEDTIVNRGHFPR